MADATVHPRSPSGQPTSAHPTRRTLLAGLALAAPAASMPALAQAAAEEPDPHPALFAEWRALIDWMNRPRPDDDRELAGCRQWRRALELERLAGATPTRTPAGALAQLRFAVAYLDEYGSIGQGVSDDAPLRGALATLDRLAGEARS